MPKPGQAQAITDEDRRRYLSRLAEMKKKDPGLRLGDIGKRVGLSEGSLSKILNGKQHQSTQKRQLDRFFGGRFEDEHVVKDLLRIVSNLDPVRRAKLHERALSLLEEQEREE